MFALKVTIELALILALLYGFYHEAEVIDWEDRKLADIKEAVKVLKWYARKKVQEWQRS